MDRWPGLRGSMGRTGWLGQVAPRLAAHSTTCGSKLGNVGDLLRGLMVFCAYAKSARERSAVRQLLARSAWLLPCVFASAALIGVVPPAAAQQFTPHTQDPSHILEGNWQSCRDRDGQYAERVYDHLVNGIPQFEVHMGPRREFAIFKGVQDVHRDHASPDNLLKPYRVLLEGARAKQRWEIPSLNLAFTVTLAGGSRTDCESWYILLQPIDKTSH
jgi:hypothetical protein